MLVFVWFLMSSQAVRLPGAATGCHSRRNFRRRWYHRCHHRHHHHHHHHHYHLHHHSHLMKPSATFPTQPARHGPFATRGVAYLSSALGLHLCQASNLRHRRRFLLSYNHHLKIGPGLVITKFSSNLSAKKSGCAFCNTQIPLFMAPTCSCLPKH